MLQTTVLVTLGLGVVLHAATITPEEDVTIVCPENIRQPNDRNANYAVVEWDEPVTPAGAVHIVSHYHPGTRFLIGRTTVTYTVRSTIDETDIASCKFDVKVVDTESPTIVCPENVRSLIGPGEGKMIVSWNEPFYSENSGFAVRLLPSHESGDVFPVGNTEVSYTVRDPFGNENECSFNISVEEVTITCPSNIRVPVDEATGSLIVTWDIPSTSGGDGVIAIDSSHIPGNEFIVGITHVTYTVRDITNNELLSNCTFEVEIIPVSISCPGNILVPNDLHVNYAIVNWSEPMAQGDEDVASTNSSHLPGRSFQIGTTTVTYYVRGIDAKPVTECSFNISVIDTEEPAILCPGDVKVFIGSDVNPPVTWSAPTSSDNSGSITVSSTHHSGAIFTVGNTIVFYTASDPYGNNNTCSFYVNITEITLICPPHIQISTDKGHAFAEVTWDPSGKDVDQDYITVSSSHDTGQWFSIGTSMVTYEARTNDDGIVTSCNFNVTVLDTEMPTIVCPPDILLFTDASVPPKVTWAATNATDNSGDVNLNCSHASGDLFPIGASQVHCTSWDLYSNRNDCHFAVYVEGVQIVCPEDVRTTINEYATTATVTWDHPEVLGGLNLIHVTSNQQPGAEFQVGVSDVEYIVYGPDSQPLTSCNFSISVYDPDIPTVICPDDIYELTESEKPTEIFWEVPQVLDFSGTARLTYHSHTPGMLFTEGTTRVTYEARDFVGKIGKCSFAITVEGVKLICPDNINTTTDLGSAYANVTWSAPEVIGGEGFLDVNMTKELWEMFPIGDSSTVFAVYDTDGTVLTDCTFDVHVNDDESPTITCPNDVRVFVEPHVSISVSWNTPLFSDNSGSVEKITSSFEPGDIFQVGSTNVSYNVQDKSGNDNGCSFLVIVEEVTLICPANINTTTDLGSAYANVTWIAPEVIGGEGFVDVNMTKDLWQLFPIGDSSTVFAVYDTDGKVLTDCTFDVHVNDAESPTITCPDDVRVFVEPHVSISVSWNTPLFSDNAGSVEKITSSFEPGDIFQVGSTNVSYNVQDKSGNDNGCSFLVVVEGVTLICPDNINTTTDLGSAYANITWSAPEVIGGEGFVDVNITKDLWQLFPIGDSSTIFAVYDTDGTVVTDCTSHVHVNDDESPTITCPDDVRVFVEPHVSISVSWNMPLFSDNSGSVEKTTSSFEPGDIFQVGSTNVSYSVQDKSGNDNECSFLVVVEEVRLECPTDINVTTDNNLSFASNVTWHPPIVLGGSGQLDLMSNREPDDFFEIGNHTVIYTASNESSFSITCDFTIFVHDIEPPFIECPDDILVHLFTGNTSTQVSWDPAVGSDNSGQTVKWVTTHEPGETFDIGSSVVTYTAVDTSGNTASCSFNVLISAFCSEDASVIGDRWEISWPATAVEVTVDSYKRCSIVTFNSHKPIATRRCVTDDHFGAIWERPVLTDCGDRVLLTLDMLNQISIGIENVIEVAEVLADVTRSMESITSKDIFEISQVMQNVVAVKTHSQQVLLAVVDTASSVLSRNISFPCQQEYVLSTEVLILILKSVEQQVAISSNASQILNIQEDGVFINSFIRSTLVRNSTKNEIDLAIDIRDSSDVEVLVLQREAGSTQNANLTEGIGMTISVFDANYQHHQLITQSPKDQQSVIVSPLVSVQMVEQKHIDLIKAVTIHIPFYRKENGHQRLLNDTVRCVLLNLGNNDYLSTEDWSVEDCNTVILNLDYVTCTCRKLAVYAIMSDYQCLHGNQPEERATLILCGRILCFLAVIALLISVVLVLAKRNWQLPTHQQILFFFYLSLLCLFSQFLLVGNVDILLFDCVIVRIFLHYFTLTTLMWSVVEAQCVYIASVKMNGIESRAALPISCTVSWLLPVVCVGITIWLRIDESRNDTACIVTDNVIGYFTLILPVCMILLHNITVYVLCSIQLLRTSRLYPLYRCVCFRLAEAVCIFSMTFCTIVFGYYWIVMPKPTYQLVFSIGCAVDGILILALSCARIIRLPGRSFTYEIHNKQRSMDKSDNNIEMNGKIYFSPVNDNLDMTNIRQAQQVAIELDKDEDKRSTCCLTDERNSVVNEHLDVCLMSSVL